MRFNDLQTRSLNYSSKIQDIHPWISKRLACTGPLELANNIALWHVKKEEPLSGFGSASMMNICGASDLAPNLFGIGVIDIDVLGRKQCKNQANIEICEKVRRTTCELDKSIDLPECSDKIAEIEKTIKGIKESVKSLKPDNSKFSMNTRQ